MGWSYHKPRSRTHLRHRGERCVGLLLTPITRSRQLRFRQVDIAHLRSVTDTPTPVCKSVHPRTPLILSSAYMRTHVLHTSACVRVPRSSKPCAHLLVAERFDPNCRKPVRSSGVPHAATRRRHVSQICHAVDKGKVHNVHMRALSSFPMTTCLGVGEHLLLVSSPPEHPR